MSTRRAWEDFDEIDELLERANRLGTQLGEEFHRAFQDLVSQREKRWFKEHYLAQWINDPPTVEFILKCDVTPLREALGKCQGDIRKFQDFALTLSPYNWSVN